MMIQLTIQKRYKNDTKKIRGVCMNNRYLKMPCTTKMVIEEIKKMCTDYIDRKVSEEEIKSYLLYWQKHCNSAFCEDGTLNPTVKTRIGAKREKIINSILNH